MTTTKPKQVLKKLKALARTQRRLVAWVKHNKTTAWPSARKQIYERAQEAARIAREKNWTKQFTAEERAEIKRLYRHIREDILRLFRELDSVFIGQRKRRKRASSGVKPKISS